jgi:hypothetical protein
LFINGYIYTFTLFPHPKKNKTMSNIQLNLINQSNDQNNSQIVIFQKNVVTGFDEIAVAWQVIKNLGHGWHHMVNFPVDISVGAEDQDGNVSDLHTAVNGQQWSVVNTPNGHEIKLKGNASAGDRVVIQNELQKGTINAQVYRDGKLLAVKTGVAPQQLAPFTFKPSIWVGIVSELQQGEIMNSAILTSVNTEISLIGIASADIVWTGGGPGSKSTPFLFRLENIVFG